MALELKEVLEEFGFEATDLEKATIDDIRKHREEKILFRETAHLDKELEKRVVGKRMGTFSKIQKDAFAELGIEFGDDEVAGKKEEEIFLIGKQKIADKLKELKEQSSKSNDDKVKSYQTKYSELENKYKEISTLYENTKGLLTQKEQEFASELKKHKIDTTYSTYKSKLNWSDEVSKDPDKLEYFDFKVKQEVDFDIDNEAGPVLRNKKTGELVLNERGNEVESVENYLRKKAMELNMLKLNNGGGGTPPQPPRQPTAPNAPQGGAGDVRDKYVQHRI